MKKIVFAIFVMLTSVAHAGGSGVVMEYAYDVPFVQINHPTEFTTGNKLQFLSYVLSISTWQQPNINIQSK